jgi:isopentenyl phosphate kinase
MYLIKLGGSVITEKSTSATFRSEIMDDLSSQLCKANKKYILVHGAGSFGHVLAKKYDLNKGRINNQQIYGFAQTQGLVQKLNSHVLCSLHQHNLPAISLPPHSLLTLTEHQIDYIALDFFKKYFDQEFLPVTYGDVVLDSKNGFSICSGDLLMLLLAEAFRPEKVIFVIDEDGIYTKNPKKHTDATLLETIQRDELDLLQTSLDAHADVTKGMAGKLQTIKKITALHIDTVLVNGLVPNRLHQVLMGQSTVQTVVKR